MTQNGICRHSLYQSSNSISASSGDEDFFAHCGCACAFGSVRGRFSARAGEIFALACVGEEKIGFSVVV